jgi:hypothetical protein
MRVIRSGISNNFIVFIYVHHLIDYILSAQRLAQISTLHQKLK